MYTHHLPVIFFVFQDLRYPPRCPTNNTRSGCTETPCSNQCTSSLHPWYPPSTPRSLNPFFPNNK